MYYADTAAQTISVPDNDNGTGNVAGAAPLPPWTDAMVARTVCASISRAACGWLSGVLGRSAATRLQASGSQW